MKLFLASRIKDPLSIKKLEEYLGGFTNKKIALIPTASNAENGWQSWKRKNDGTWQFVHKLGAKVTDVVLEEYRDESVIKLLEGQDVIWFMGGMAGYLSYWIRRCKIDLNIRKLLKNGTVYVGSSAGAMVAGQTLQISNWLSVDGERGSENIEPMKLVEFDIFPHYKDSYKSKIKGKYKGPKLYLLKDGEEIIVDDNKITVVGKERIISNE